MGLIPHFWLGPFSNRSINLNKLSWSRSYSPFGFVSKNTGCPLILLFGHGNGEEITNHCPSRVEKNPGSNFGCDSPNVSRNVSVKWHTNSGTVNVPHKGASSAFRELRRRIISCRTASVNKDFMALSPCEIGKIDFIRSLPTITIDKRQNRQNIRKK